MCYQKDTHLKPTHEDWGLTANQSWEDMKIITHTCKLIKSVNQKYIYKDIHPPRNSRVIKRTHVLEFLNKPPYIDNKPTATPSEEVIKIDTQTG